MGAALLAFMQAAVGATLLAAAMAKLGRSPSLEPFLLALGLRGDGARRVAALAAPLEAGTGAALLLGVFVAWLSPVAAALALSFVALQLLAWRRGLAGGCRCFGALDSHESVGFALVRAILLAAAAAAVAVGNLATDEPAAGVIGGEHPGALVAGALTGVAIVGALALLAEVWWFEHRRPRALPRAARSVPPPPEVTLYGGQLPGGRAA